MIELLRNMVLKEDYSMKYVEKVKFHGIYMF